MAGTRRCLSMMSILAASRQIYEPSERVQPSCRSFSSSAHLPRITKAWIAKAPSKKVTVPSDPRRWHHCRPEVSAPRQVVERLRRVGLGRIGLIRRLESRAKVEHLQQSSIMLHDDSVLLVDISRRGDRVELVGEGLANLGGEGHAEEVGNEGGSGEGKRLDTASVGELLVVDVGGEAGASHWVREHARFGVDEGHPAAWRGSATSSKQEGEKKEFCEEGER